MNTKHWITVLFLAWFTTMSVSFAKSYDVVGAHFPPWMYEEEGKAKGFYVDLLEMMVEESGDIETTITFYPVPRLLYMLSTRADTFSLGIAKSKELEPQYKWVGPIYPRIFAIYKLASRDDLVINHLLDLQEYTVGVGRGYAAVDDLINAGVPKDNIKEVTLDIQNVRKLFSGRIDLIVANDMVLADLIHREGHKWEEVEQTIILSDQYSFSYAFNKSFDDEVIKRLQQSLDYLKQDGRYDELVEKYFY